MSEEFATFQKMKNQEYEKKKAERAEKTLEIYKLIDEMLQNPDYDDNQKFLYSVQEYIEEHQYVSDKQILIIDRIYRHPNHE